MKKIPSKNSNAGSNQTYNSGEQILLNILNIDNFEGTSAPTELAKYIKKTKLYSNLKSTTQIEDFINQPNVLQDILNQPYTNQQDFEQKINQIILQHLD